MPAPGLAFVMYAVKDMARSVKFYTEVLGLAKGELASDMWTEFDLSGACFGIGAFEQAGTPGNGTSLAIEVEDMAAYRAMLKEKGIDTVEPYETPVCFMTFIKDPDDNSIIIHKAKH